MKPRAEWYKVTQTMLSVFVIAALAITATGCGKSEDENVAPGPIVGPPAPGYPGFPGVGTCIPVDQPLSFTATGIYVDSASVKFGPAFGAGTVAMVPGNVAGQFLGMGVDGTFNVSFALPNAYNPYNPYNPYGSYPQPYPQPYPYPGSPSYPGTPGVGAGTANGTLILSPMTRDQIRFYMGPGACVIALSANLGYSTAGGMTPYVYGDIVLQLNGGQNGQSQTYQFNITRPF